MIVINERTSQWYSESIKATITNTVYLCDVCAFNYPSLVDDVVTKKAWPKEDDIQKSCDRCGIHFLTGKPGFNYYEDTHSPITQKVEYSDLEPIPITKETK